MITLIIETSTDKSLIIIADEEKVLFQKFLPVGGLSSRYLMEAISLSLSEIKILPSELEAVGVSIGPGSYTGIRVGVAAAKGIAFAKSLPLVGFCSLEGFESDKAPFATLIDARLGGYYVLLPNSPPQFIPTEGLPTYLKDYPNQAGPHLGYPSPTRLAQIVSAKLERGEFSDELDLLYLRTPNYSY